MHDGESATRSAALNGVALAAVAVGSAVQVALYLHDFGATHFTDGMIAAVAVYSFVTTVAQLLRTSAVPLISGERQIVSTAAFGWTMAVTALAVTVLCFAAAAPLAHIVAGSAGAHGVSVATTALRIMSTAIGLQIAGATLSVVGAVRGRLNVVALGYAASGILGVVGYAVLESGTGVQVLAWTNVVSALVIVAVLVTSLRIVPAAPPAARRLLASASALFHSLPLPASFILMYPLTLALVPAGPPGRVTLFGLAFTGCSYLAGFTAQALSMSEVVALSRSRPEDSELRRRVILRAFRYSLLLAAPGAAVAVVAGGPLVSAVMRAKVGASGVQFGTDMALLGPLLVANLGVWATLPAVLSVPDLLTRRRLFAAVLVLVVVHVLTTLIGRAVFGFDGIVVAMAAAPIMFVFFGQLRVAPGAAAPLLRQVLTVCPAVVITFGVIATVVKAAGLGDTLGEVAAAAAATLLYGLFVCRFYPDEARTLMSVIGSA